MQTPAATIGRSSARPGLDTTGGAHGLRRFLRPSLADALFILLLLRILQLGTTGLFNDPGTGWHLQTGRLIVATGDVPRTDPFSFTRAGHHWVESQWLGDVVMSLTFDLGGYSLIALGTAATLAALLRWIYRTHVSAGGWPAIGLVTALVAACAASGHFLARPLVASSIGVPLSFWWATQYARGRIGPGRLWLLIALTVVWANMHPGVLGGIATVGLCGLGTWLSGWWTGRDDRRRGQHLVLVALVMGGATLVNPYGLDWHVWISGLMSMPALRLYVTEWLAPVWHDPEVLAAGLLVMTMSVACMFRRRELRMGELLVIAFWTWQAVGSARHVPLAGLIVALQLGRLLANADAGGGRLGRMSGRLPVFSDDVRQAERRSPGGLASATAVMIAVAVLLSGWTVPALGLGTAGPPPDRYSAGAVSWLRANAPAGNLFNDLNYGGTLIQEVPGFPVFADDRFGLYGERFLDEYRAAVLGPAEDAERLLDRWRIETVLVGAQLPLSKWLTDSGQWEAPYQDRIAGIYVRRRDGAETSR